MSKPVCTNSNQGFALKTGLPVALALGVSIALLPSFSVGNLAAYAQEPSATKTEQGSEVQDWRDAMLNELARLANALEKEQKFNQILRDKVDILNHRLDALESDNQTKTDQIEALLEAQELNAAQGKPAPLAEQKPEADPMPEQHAQAPNESQPSKPNADEKSALPEEFDQFLDLGEAMMRRFFGVVKEFRKEFDDNQV